MNKTRTLSNAQHALLCEVIAGRVIVEEHWKGDKLRYFTAIVGDVCQAYGHPRYVRNVRTVLALLENGLIGEFVLWTKSSRPRKVYKGTEKAMNITAACTAHRKDRKKRIERKNSNDSEVWQLRNIHRH